MAFERKEGEMQVLTSYNEHKAIAVKFGKYRSEDQYFIVSDFSGKEPIEIKAPGGTDREEPKVEGFKKGVAVMQAECNRSYNKRDFDDWQTFTSMITPSGFSIEFGAKEGVAFDEQEAVKYARSIFDNPAEILNIDKKLEMASAEMIKGYVDIAKAGLEASLEKAGSDYSRDAYWGGFSDEDRKKAAEAGPNYEKTLAVISKLSKKIAAKFQKMSAEYNKKMANSLSGKVKATKRDIAAIFDEPQRGQ